MTDIPDQPAPTRSADSELRPFTEPSAPASTYASAPSVPARIDASAPAGPDAAGEADPDDADLEVRDWAWVEEWREGGEPVPWGPGLGLAGFALFLVASAVYVLSSGLSDHPILAIGINIIVAGGLGPALWLSRGLPVLRWIAGGAVLGVLTAWISVLVFLT